MANTRKIANLLGTAALTAAAVAPAALSAQYAPGVRSSSVATYHMMQLSVSTASIGLEEFKAQTETIRSCGDAKRLAEPLGAEIRRDRFVRATQLPDDLQETLADLQTGHASEVFTADGTVMRVLVICGRG